MKVVQQVIGKSVEARGDSGDNSSGWLPPNAAIPLRTPIGELVLNVRILAGEGEFILEWQSTNRDYSNDSWHSTIEEAQREAKLQFGIEASEWQDVD